MVDEEKGWIPLLFMLFLGFQILYADICSLHDIRTNDIEAIMDILIGIPHNRKSELGQIGFASPVGACIFKSIML